MDHKAFDDRIKEKLSGLNPSYRPSSWDDMEDILTYGVTRPWYKGWKAISAISGLVLFSAINFYLLWQIKKERFAGQEPNRTSIQQVVVVDTIYVADTVYLTASQAANVYNQSPYALNAGGQPGSDHLNKSKAQLFIASANIGSGGLYRKSIRSFMSANSMANITYHSPLVGGGLMDPMDNHSQWSIERPLVVPFIGKDAQDPLTALRAMALGYEVTGSSFSREKIKRAFKPAGKLMRIGVVGGILIPNPDIGERYISNKIGLATEIGLKRNLRFITGLHLGKLTYKLDEVDDNNFNPDDLQSYPGYDELNKTPDEITINNKLLQLPLHLRYYKPLNYNWSVFISGGPTLDLLLNQEFKYNYLDIDDDQLIVVNEVTEQKDLKLYLGNFTGSFGIEHNFTQNLAGQVSIDYQYGLGKLGVEKRSVNSLGLNLSAYYKLK